MKMSYSFGVGLLCVCCGSVVAQSRSSFSEVENVSGITVVRSGHTYTVEMGSNPTVRINGVDYVIETIFGFWCLSDDTNFSMASGADSGDWSFHRNSAGTGDIAGWKTNPNRGLVADERRAFTFTSFKESDRDGYGFHVRVEGRGGNTFYITGPFFEPRCIADYNQDGGIDGSDYSDFFNDWESGELKADLNGDGVVDGADVVVFTDPWKSGAC